MNTLEKPAEHRWGSRVHLKSDAMLRDVHESESPAVLRNASVGGGFIETGTRPALFARVDVQPANGPWIEARVVRITAQGIGVEWLEPASAEVLGVLSTPRMPPPRSRPRWLSIVDAWRSQPTR